MSNVFRRLAQDRGFVQLMRGREASEIVIALNTGFRLDLFHDINTFVGVLQAMDHYSERGHRVTKSSDFVVEICSIALFDHVVGRLLGAEGRFAAGGVVF